MMNFCKHCQEEQRKEHIKYCEECSKAEIEHIKHCEECGKAEIDKAAPPQVRLDSPGTLVPAVAPPSESELVPSFAGCARAHEAGIGGLVHQTSQANAVRILKSGTLLTGRELVKLPSIPQGWTTYVDEAGQLAKDQFIGVYLTPLPYGRSMPLDVFYDSDVAFVFSPALLDRADYHMNLRDQQGYLTKLSYAPQTLRDVSKQEWRQPEIVFHNPVSLEYLERIYVHKDLYVPFVERLQRELLPDQFNRWASAVEVYKKKGIPGKPPWQLHCDRENQWPYWPRYCAMYPNDPSELSDEDFNRIMPDLKIARKIAVNCGIPREEASKLSYSELQEHISAREDELLDHPNEIIIPAPYLPPFRDQD